MLQSAKVKDQQAKQSAKAYADKRNRARPSDIKLSMMYDPKLYTVLERKGLSLILQQEGTVFM